MCRSLHKTMQSACKRASTNRLEPFTRARLALWIKIVEQAQGRFGITRQAAASRQRLDGLPWRNAQQLQPQWLSELALGWLQRPAW